MTAQQDQHKEDGFGFSVISEPEKNETPEQSVRPKPTGERKLVRDFIITFFKCRKEHKVKVCNDCSSWSEKNMEHFIDCPHLADHIMIRRMAHEMESELNLKNIELPPEIYRNLFPEKKEKREAPFVRIFTTEAGRKNKSKSEYIGDNS